MGESEMEPTENEQNLTQTLEETRALNQRRVRERKRKRRLRALKTAALVLGISVVLMLLGIFVYRAVAGTREQAQPPEQPAVREPAVQEQEPTVQKPAEPPQEAPEPEEQTPVELETTPMEVEAEPSEPEPVPLPDEPAVLDLQLYSENAILIDRETGTVLAEKNPDAKIYPASMTKVMTALVACEQMPDWDATFSMTQEIIDPFYLADATLAGFVHGEQVSMMDLIYGAILPSGAEATEALARVVAGSEEAFTERMNEKAKELGLTQTHFVDASGLHNEEHYTTVREMAVIMEAAMQNERCREALGAAYHCSAATEQNPNGVEMYNKFLLRIRPQCPEGIEIAAAKTGYTAQAMNCCASAGVGQSGREVICVTAHAWTGDFCIADHLTLYGTYS